jgi:hypothetical protein
VKQGCPREILDRVATEVDAAIRRAGEDSAEVLLASRHQPRSAEKKDGHVGTDLVFQAMGAIIYDMEWTSDDGEPEFRSAEILADATNTISPNLQLDDWGMEVLELMLLVDYGFPAYSVFEPLVKDRSLWGCDQSILWSFERASGLLAATAWRWRQGCAIPDQDAWDLIARVLGDWELWPSDWA